MTEKRKGVHSLGFFHHPSLFSLPYLLSPIRLYETAEVGAREMEKERTNLSHPSPRPPSVSCGPIDREERGQGKGMGREKASLYSFHLPSLSIGGFYHL